MAGRSAEKVTHGQSLIFNILAEFSRICTQTNPHQTHNPGPAFLPVIQIPKYPSYTDTQIPRSIQTVSTELRARF